MDILVKMYSSNWETYKKIIIRKQQFLLLHKMVSKLAKMIYDTSLLRYLEILFRNKDMVQLNIQELCVFIIMA